MPGGGEEVQELVGEEPAKRDEVAKPLETPAIAAPAVEQPELPARGQEAKVSEPPQTVARPPEPLPSTVTTSVDGAVKPEVPPAETAKEEPGDIAKQDPEAAERPQELLIRVPFEIELPASASVQEFLSIVASRLQEAKVQPAKDVSELLLGIGGQTVDDPQAQPFKFLVPGSVVSLVEEAPEAAEVASLGLCLNAKHLHMMQAQSQILKDNQVNAAPLFAQSPVPAPPPVEQASANNASASSQAVKNGGDIRAQVQREQRERFYKTRMCMNYAQGLCTYGPRCTFAHGDRELRQRTEGAAPADAPQATFGDSTSGGASSSWDNGKNNWDNNEQWSSWKDSWKGEDWKDASWHANGDAERDSKGWYQSSSTSEKWTQDQNLDDDLDKYWRSGKDSNSKDSWAPDSWESGGHRRNDHQEDRGYGINGAKRPSDRSLSRALRRSDRGDSRERDLRYHREEDIHGGRSGRSALRSSAQSSHRARPLQSDRRDDSLDSLRGNARSSTRREGDLRIQEPRRSSGHSETLPLHRSRAPRDRATHRDAVPPPPRKDDSDDFTYSDEDIDDCERSRSDRYKVMSQGGDARYRDVRTMGSRRDREVHDRHTSSRSHRSSATSRHESHYDSLALSSGRSEGRRHSDRSPPPPKRHRR